jgi:hypothetical protein
MSQPARPTTASFLGAVPPCATVVWLATSVLYFADLPNLPNPAIAVVASSALALVAASLVVVLGSDGQPDPRSGSPLPGAPAQTRPARAVPLPAPAELAPRAPPERPPVRPLVVINLLRYPPVEATERQCTYCGGFEIDVRTNRSGGLDWECRTCFTAGPVDPIINPDVIVRSWLHQ